MANSPNKSRTASLHTDAYAAFVQILVQKRIRSGLSQQAVADELGWNQSIIAKIESVQRRLDVIELVQIAGVVGFDPSRLVKDIQVQMLTSRHG